MLIEARSERRSRRLRSILLKMELTRPAPCAFAGETDVSVTAATKTSTAPSANFFFMRTPSKIEGNLPECQTARKNRAIIRNPLLDVNLVGDDPTARVPHLGRPRHLQIRAVQ